MGRPKGRKPGLGSATTPQHQKPETSLETSLKGNHPLDDSQLEEARNELLHFRHARLAKISQSHESQLRELFHLQNRTTLVDFDPAKARDDNSDIWRTYFGKHNLFSHATDGQGVGASGRRTTRHQMDVLRGPKSPVKTAPSQTTQKHQQPPVEVNDDEEIVASPSPTEEDLTIEDEDLNTRPKKKPRLNKVKGKGAKFVSAHGPRRISIRLLAAELPHDAEEPLQSTEAQTSPKELKVKLKKYTNNRIYSGAYKRLRLTTDDPPDLAPTNPAHLLAKTSFGGDVSAYLTSYNSLEDDTTYVAYSKQALWGKSASRFTAEERITREAALLTRFEELRREGRFIDSSNKWEPSRRRPAPEPSHPTGHWGHLLEQGLYFSELVRDERSKHVASAKKVSKLVTGYWDRKGNEKERELEKEEREGIRRAKWILKEVRKQWKFAFNIINAQRLKVEREEADKLAKEHLNIILQKSSRTLEAQGLDIVALSDATTSPEVSSDEDQDDEDQEAEIEDERQADEAAAENIGSSHVDPTVEADIRVLDQPTLPIPRKGSPSALDVTSSAQQNSMCNSDQSTSTDPTTLPDSTTLPSKLTNTSQQMVDSDFSGSEDENREAADDEFAAEMEAEEQEGDEVSSDAEMAGLKEDADLPIEELMKKYGYGAAVNGNEAHSQTETSNQERSVNDENDNHSEPQAVDGIVEEGTKGRVREEQDVDNDFQSELSVELDAVDLALENDMHQEDTMSSDGEEERGLAADAEISIEALRERYQALYEQGDASPTAESEDGPEAKDENDKDLAEAQSSDAESDREEDSIGSEQAVEENDVDEAVSEDAKVRGGVRVPFLLRASMRPYQKTGLDWLVSLHTQGLNGILADEMGLGKTLQTISVLAHLACDKGIWGPHLVVVPTSVMLNWDTEFKKFFPGFKVLTYYGNLKERKEKRKGWNTENHFHVVVTSYQLVLADQHIFRRKPWYYLVLDEAHHIKNFRSKRWETLLGFNTQRRLLLTGTPLQNNLMELWSLLYFLMPPGIADENGPFASSDLFKEWFSAGTEKAIESGEGIDRETVAKLHTVLRPYLLRRLKSEVEKQMPGKYEHIIYCKLSKRQRFLYDDYMSRAKTRETLVSGNYMSIINCLMQLRKVCNHPDLFEVRPIVTSFALRRAPIVDYEINELLVRRRLLATDPTGMIDFKTLKLTFVGNEGTSSLRCSEISRLHASHLLPAQYDIPEDVDLDDLCPKDTKSIAGWKLFHEQKQHLNALDRLQRMRDVNQHRCSENRQLAYGSELLNIVKQAGQRRHLLPLDHLQSQRGFTYDDGSLIPSMIVSLQNRVEMTVPILQRFAFATPLVFAPQVASYALAMSETDQIIARSTEHFTDVLGFSATKLSIAFPDRSLLQYDCGKLQELAELMRRLDERGSRALIFTQMTKVLDILEEFLTFNGYRYLRLDGSTKVEDRQLITERFNTDPKIKAFISSTRAGGLGINLTGADTVIFYDNDWNPSMDRQCQDRCHRIGQTRDVHIYRFVSEHTIEENMLRKANQKRLLDDAVIQDGDFTTDYFARMNWKDMIGNDMVSSLKLDDADVGHLPDGDKEAQQALAAAEDEEDARAAKEAEVETEVQLDGHDFAADDGPTNNTSTNEDPASTRPLVPPPGGKATPATPVTEAGPSTPALVGVEEVDDGNELEGTVDGWMLRWVDMDFDWFSDGQRW